MFAPPTITEWRSRISFYRGLDVHMWRRTLRSFCASFSNLTTFPRVVPPFSISRYVQPAIGVQLPPARLSEFLSRIRGVHRLVLRNITVEALQPVGPDLISVELRKTDRLDIASFDTVLRACPRLKELVVVDVYFSSHENIPEPGDVFISPRLTNLTLSNVSMPLHRHVYRTLRAPALS
jgi:hypothetical protein